MRYFAKKIFMKLQNANTIGKIEELRPYLTESFFEQSKRKIQNYVDTNRIKVVDDILIRDSAVYGFKQEGDKDILDLALKATEMDYIIDTTTNKIIDGIKGQGKITVYKLTFERKSGVNTLEETNDIQAINCLDCGAQIQDISTGRCPNCGSAIIVEYNIWKLSGVEPIKE